MIFSPRVLKNFPSPSGGQGVVPLGPQAASAELEPSSCTASMVLVALCAKTTFINPKEKKERKKRLEKKSHICFFFKKKNNLILILWSWLSLLKEHHTPRFVRILLWLPKMSQQAFRRPMHLRFLEGCPAQVKAHGYHPLQG